MILLLTFCTPSAKPPVTFWYHSGVAGRSFSRIDCAFWKYSLAVSESVAEMPSERSLSNSGFE